MKTRTWTGWIVTGLMAALMLLSALPDVLRIPDALLVFKHLGYPPFTDQGMGFRGPDLRCDGRAVFTSVDRRPAWRLDARDHCARAGGRLVCRSSGPAQIRPRPLSTVTAFPSSPSTSSGAERSRYRAILLDLTQDPHRCVSSGAIGRLAPEDVAGLVKYVDAHRNATDEAALQTR
jgi:hypothetical protein